MMKFLPKICLLLSVSCLLVSAANADPISTDPAAILNGSRDFSFVTDFTLGGYVDYAVYEDGGVYTYAYQFKLENIADIKIDSFGINLEDEMNAYDPGVDSSLGMPGGIAPIYQTIVPDDRAVYFFLGLTEDDHSQVLIYKSDLAPAWGYGYFNGLFEDYSISGLPVPTPEPATIAILGLSSIFVFRRKKA